MASTPARTSSFDPLFGALAHAHRGADAQLAETVARGIGEVGLLGDVLHRDQALELEGVVDHEHAFQLVLVQQRLGVFDGGVPSGTVTRRSRGVMISLTGASIARFETQVAAGDDAHHSCPSQHRETRCRAARQRHDLAHRDLGRDDDGSRSTPDS
jgi:hypothetical protein